MSRKRKAVYKITCIFTSFVRIFLGVEIFDLSKLKVDDAEKYN